MNILMIIAPSNFRDEELLKPKEIFEQNGFNVTVASIRVKQATGMLGATVDVDKDISEISLDTICNDYNAVVFIGGTGIEEYKSYENPRILELARTASKCKIIAAICLAPKILAAAGITKGKQSTVYEAGAQFLRNKEVEYTQESVVVDGNIITADGPDSATGFTNKIIEMLK